MITSQGRGLIDTIACIGFSTKIRRLRVIQEWKLIGLTWKISEQRGKIKCVLNFFLLYLCDVIVLYLIAI